MFDFSRLGRTRMQAVFDEPELSSDGGALLIREAADVNGIIDAVVKEIIGLPRRIVRRIRERFPNTMLIFRANSQHNKPAVLD